MTFSTGVGLLAAIAFVACDAFAADALPNIPPGVTAVTGNISEWPVPTPKYARDPAVSPAGSVYYAVRDGDRIARFDAKDKHFHEWDIPAGSRPRCPVVTADGKIIFGASGNSSIGELDPANGKVKLFKIPSGTSDPYTLVVSADGNIWFTDKNGGKVGMLERASGTIREYPVGVGAYSLAFDKGGNIWVTRKDADRLVKFDPRTGQFIELSFAKGAQPRRIAMAPDGMLWVTLYGNGKLAKVDPVTNQIVKEYELPGGPNAGPYAVNTDALGRIWVSEIQTDSIIAFDPRSSVMRVFKLPNRDSGVRNATIDAAGRYWYVGSHKGVLGFIQ